ncbi:biotin/lipoyl-containing protein, partial [Litorisediminicola beolgyonensis]
MSEPAQIRMPALSPGMEEGRLARWLVREGDRVEAGDVIAEIETDKATLEFETEEGGVIGALLVAAGTSGIKVDTPIAELGSGAAARTPSADRSEPRPAAP